MTEWIECTLDKLGEIVGGATPSTKCEDYYGGSIPWITPKDLSSFKGRYITSGERNITEKGLASCSAQMMPKDAVLFTSRAPIGYVAIASQSVCTNQGFKSIVVNEKADPLFVYYLLKYNKDAIEAMGSGTTFKEVSGKTMRAVKVRIPLDVSYQKRIAAVLDSLDTKIENNERINDNLEAQTQALFDELFLRDGMPDCTLSEIANVNPTRTLSKGCIAKCYDMSCLPTRGCIPEGGEMKAYNGGVRFQNGDTLIARITPCLENGKAAYINILNDKEVAFGSTEYIVFSPVDTMPSSFYYFLIRSKKFRTFALQYMNGSSGRQRVSGDELAAFPLTKPSHEALSRFDMVAKPVLEQFKVASLEINRLNALQQLIIASISSR